LTLINDILDLSKIESGHLELESIHFDLIVVHGDRVEALGSALGITKKKDIDGSLAMKKMCSPPFRFEPHLFAALLDYCARDVDALAQCDTYLRRLSSEELAVWHANFRCNQRGLRIDQELIEAVTRLSAEEDIALEDQAEVIGLTPSIIRSQQQFRSWALSQGVDLPDLSKATLGDLEIDNPTVRTGLEIREQVCKSSLAKFQAMLDHAEPDGRARGNHLYHRATTGRFAGSGIQIHNMPRPVVEDTDKLAEDIIAGNDLREYGRPIKDLCASVVRSAIVPAEGQELIVADFASIESKVIFFLSGCAKGLQVFRDGLDLYCVTASGIYGREITKKENPTERQIGKIAVLSLGFQGGPKAFDGMCSTFGVDTSNLDLQGIVDGFRRTYPEVVDYWAQCEHDAIEATLHPGARVGAFKVSDKYNALGCFLPSGRVISWNKPSIKKNKFGKNAVHFWGMGRNRTWQELSTYGGDLCQSAVQATARDLLACALVRCDARGWHPVLHVHDEIMLEEPIGTVTVKDLVDEMCRLPAWAQGLPISAEGFVSRRYRK
jgi:DNA polymerase